MYSFQQEYILNIFKMNTPLAERMRPQNLDDYAGQTHLIAPGKPLRRAIEQGLLPSMIFWGPPGVGKTTLANIISNMLKRPFYTLSAVNSGVKDVREVIEKAQSQHFFGQNKPVMFIDEIHRFSKSQQDSLIRCCRKRCCYSYWRNYRKSFLRSYSRTAFPLPGFCFRTSYQNRIRKFTYTRH